MTETSPPTKDPDFLLGHRQWFAEPNSPPIETPTSLPDALFPTAAIPPKNDEPMLSILLGPIASGKTRFRKKHFAESIVVDPAVVYMYFTSNDTRIPENIGPMVQETGIRLVAEALRQRRNMVIEIVPVELSDQDMTRVLDMVRGLGYKLDMQFLGVAFDVSLAQSDARGPLNISAYHTERDTMMWLESAVGLLQGESNKLVDGVAESLCNHIAGLTIEELKEETMARFNIGSSVLRNLWDEIVVQYASEHGIGWELTEQHVEATILQIVKPLSYSDKIAIWLQTDGGFDWSCQDELRKGLPPVDEWEIVRHVLHQFVYPQADNDANTDERLNRFIEGLTSD